MCIAIQLEKERKERYGNPPNHSPDVHAALGVLCCFAFCLTLLASFFHLSFKNMNMYM